LIEGHRDRGDAIGTDGSWLVVPMGRPALGIALGIEPILEQTSVTPTIRFLAPGDFSQWLPLWEGYNKFYGRADETALPREITQTTWARFFDGYEPVRAIVAEDDGQLVGLVHYLFHRSTISIAPTCYLQDLFTRESTRGKGVGQP
jgi:hypothetical protein